MCVIPVIIGELRELQSGSRTALREAGRGASCKSGTCTPQGRLQSHVDPQINQSGISAETMSMKGYCSKRRS